MTTDLDFDTLLKRYAEVIVRVGVSLREGQRLIIFNSTARGVPPAGRDLVHAVTKTAYAAGARFVEVIWGDEEMLRLQLTEGSEASLREYATWKTDAIYDFLSNGDALLSIYANDPDPYVGIDPARISILQKVHLEKYAKISELVSRNAANWCVVAAASPAWAKKIFPDLSEAEGQQKLWQAIFDVTRITQPDPLEAWQEHIRSLRTRAQYLQDKKYTALHYTAPGTDLTLGLPYGHKWISAQALAENGVMFTANVPTEEAFTIADRNRADGVVKSTFPLSYGGSLIEDFSVTFENGRVVKVEARKNEAILQKLVEMDEGASRLGEIALVPASSPIATRGHLFYNTLFDENASCHIAIGRAYRFTLIGGEELTEEEFRQAGGNTSITHIDFMIGSPQMDIDGITADGTHEPVMRQGEWAFLA